MMITPRHFEEMMQEIADEFQDNPKEKDNRMMALMADVLDTYGYQAGTRIYRGDKDADNK